MLAMLFAKASVSSIDAFLDETCCWRIRAFKPVLQSCFVIRYHKAKGSKLVLRYLRQIYQSGVEVRRALVDMFPEAGVMTDINA